ncbi:MAG TPA: RNA polymerase sigma factor [Armatimonadota bacterium]|nr:RNA polymerase sigma factor [Armatimonadota bacterium]
MDGSAKLAPPVDGGEEDLSRDSDEWLASQISRGDVAAWESFFERYAPWAYRFGYHHLAGNRADAEDLCSDILMVAARSIKSYDSRRGALDVWLLGLARHRLVRFCRRRRTEVPLVPEATASGANAEAAIANPWTEATLQRDLVNRALASIPKRQVSVLIGKYVSGYSVDELANHLQSTPKAVESLLSRARAAFRSAFTSLARGNPGGENHG